MSRNGFTCLLGIIVPWMIALGGSAVADETFTATTIIPVPGGIHSFDIGFVDADINTYVVADRTNAAVDVIDTRTNTLVKQLKASPPFAGVRHNPGAASGPCAAGTSGARRCGSGGAGGSGRPSRARCACGASCAGRAG